MYIYIYMYIHILEYLLKPSHSHPMTQDSHLKHVQLLGQMLQELRETAMPLAEGDLGDTIRGNIYSSYVRRHSFFLAVFIRDFLPLGRFGGLTINNMGILDDISGCT